MNFPAAARPYLMGIAAIVLISGDASAADATVNPVYDSDVVAFSGGFIGASLSGVESDFSKNCNGSDSDQLCSGYYATYEGGTSIGGGIRAGYNWETANMVSGIIADADYYGGNDAGIEYLASLRARIGPRIGDRGLLYAAGGVAIGGFTDARVDDVSGSNPNVVGDSEVGWVGSIGYEHLVTDKVSLFGEFNYYEFSHAVRIFDDSRYESITSDADVKQVKIGVNWHF